MLRAFLSILKSKDRNYSPRFVVVRFLSLHSLPIMAGAQLLWRQRLGWCRWVCVRCWSPVRVFARGAESGAVPPADVLQLPRASCQLLQPPSSASLTEWATAHASIIIHAQTSQHCNTANSILDSINHIYLSCGDRRQSLKSCNWASTHANPHTFLFITTAIILC